MITEKHDRSVTEALVSATIAFLNAEKFLAETIESVLAQTYPNWELWLVDDGSTDGSSQIARDYAARHADRIHYLEHPGHENRGKSASRNLGLRHARGRYVTWLDADDVWLPGWPITCRSWKRIPKRPCCMVRRSSGLAGRENRKTSQRIT